MRVFKKAILLTTACCATLAWASGSELSRQVQQQDGWVAYRVPLVAGSGSSCCYSGDSKGDFRRTGCDLDSRKGGFTLAPSDAEASNDLSIYWHVVNGKADQIKAFSADCPVTSKAAIRWIESVEPADSITNIVEWVDDRKPDRDSDSSALAAIALHQDASATAALIEFAGADREQKLRTESIFWLGQTRGAAGADFIEQVATTDPSDKMREHAVFSLSQSDQRDAYSRVHAISKQDDSAKVRGHALFWMAQMDDPRAQADIIAALDRETSEDVRDEAVFALSQLDENEATAALISIIRGNYPRSVKEKALFWLGETGTDAALAFIDSVLAR